MWSAKTPEPRRRPGPASLRGLWTVIAVLMLALPVTAEFYRYTDADGQVHYVDNPGEIPDSQLGTVRVYQEEVQDPPGAGDRDRQDEAAAAVEGAWGGQAPSSSSVLESPVIVRGNRVLVPVVIGHLGRKVEANLLLDTGASLTILHASVARQVMLAGMETREAVVVGGSRVSIRMAAADYLQVGPYKIANAQVAIIRHQGPAQGHQGLLGMNILRNLDYKLDVNRGVIVWNR